MAVVAAVVAAARQLQKGWSRHNLNKVMQEADHDAVAIASNEI